MDVEEELSDLETTTPAAGCFFFLNFLVLMLLFRSINASVSVYLYVFNAV